jgi:hypothetical protein
MYRIQRILTQILYFITDRFFNQSSLLMTSSNALFALQAFRFLHTYISKKKYNSKRQKIKNYSKTKQKFSTYLNRIFLNVSILHLDIHTYCVEGNLALDLLWEGVSINCYNFKNSCVRYYL